MIDVHLELGGNMVVLNGVVAGRGADGLAPPALRRLWFWNRRLGHLFLGALPREDTLRFLGFGRLWLVSDVMMRCS